MQEARLAPLAPMAISLARRRQHAIRVEADEGIEVASRNAARDERLGIPLGRDVAADHVAHGVGCRKIGQRVTGAGRRHALPARKAADREA